MSVKLSWRHFQLVLLIGYRYVFRLSDCLVLNATNGQTFSPNASAEFECIIDPYTFSQAWFVDSISVADCGFSTCSENASNPARYSFTPNTSAGNFIFKIDPISLEDNDNVIRCFDGTNFKEISISVTVNDNGGGGGGDGGDGDGGGTVLLAALIPSVTLVFIFSIVLIIICYIKKQHTHSCHSVNVGPPPGKGKKEVSVNEEPAPGKETQDVSVNVKPAPGKETPEVSDNGSSSDEEHTIQFTEKEKDKLVDLMKCQETFRTLMYATKNGLSQLYQIEQLQKDELFQKIAKVTYPATRDHILKKQLEWIHRIIWMTEQGIDHLYKELKREEHKETETFSWFVQGLMRYPFSSFLMKALHEDKAYYDIIIQALHEDKPYYDRIIQALHEDKAYNDRIIQGFQIEKPKDGRKKRNRRPNQQ